MGVDRGFMQNVGRSRVSAKNEILARQDNLLARHANLLARHANILARHANILARHANILASLANILASSRWQYHVLASINWPIIWRVSPIY